MWTQGEDGSISGHFLVPRFWPKIPADCFSTREKRDTGQIGHGTQRWLYSHSLPRPSRSKCSIIRTDIRGAAPHHKGTPKIAASGGPQNDTGPLNWDTGTPGVGGTPRGDG